MRPITYSLNDLRGNSDFFYWQLTRVTDIVLWKSERIIGQDVNQYLHYNNYLNLEKPRSRHEYIIEVLSLGVLWNEYSGRAIIASTWKLKILALLFRGRQNIRFLKPIIDKLRGLLMTIWLSKKESPKEIEFNLKNLNRLLNWLEASGDFRGISERLRNLQNILKVMPENHTLSTLQRTQSAGTCFSDLCSSTLGEFTWRVDHFITKKHPDYRYRENYIYCGSSETEYHLNMVGAEVFNRVQSEEFQSKPSKAILLPTCMKNIPADECLSIDEGDVKRCIACNPLCNVCKVTQSINDKNVKVYIVPHSSNFIKYIKRWEGSSNIGLVGVACVLNLLEGGYEIKNLNIPAQCVSLDHCGCRKHWDPNGVITSFSLSQIEKVIAPNTNEQVTADKGFLIHQTTI